MSKEKTLFTAHTEMRPPFWDMLDCKRWILILLLGLVGGVQAQEWERAVGPRVWAFPRDHGAHPDFKTEWWYFTGNLEDEHGRPFGYQFTIFRQGIFREPVQKQSKWAVRDVYFGHFTTSDISNDKFYFSEKIDRGALDQSGASLEKMSVHLLDWSIEPNTDFTGESYQLKASAPDRSIEFTVTPTKPLVLEGNQGLSQKATAVGNASYYYSFPRLQTQGVLKLNGKTFTLHGTSWFDHEFSTSSLGTNQVGWDWFCLQFDNGEELMLYCLRNKDGSLDSTSRGVWIDSHSQKQDILPGEFTVENLAFWQSPYTPGKYPAKWRIHLPKLQTELLIEPRMADQELRLHELGDLSYWEGACQVRGQKGSEKITGVGYTELTGYASALGKGMKE